MLKAANVTALRCCSVSPGKYLALISGDTGSVNAAMDAGEKAGGEYIVDVLRIPKVHPQLIPALSGTAEVVRGEAVGGLEYFSVASAVIAADEAPKAAAVSLIDVRIGYAVGGKGVVLFTGETGAVEKALEAAKNRTSGAGLLVCSTLINRPSEELYQSLL
jgi:microcompartment protein CcmL/EutN